MQKPAPLFSTSDFTNALYALLPRGKVWPRDPDSVIAQYVATFAPTFARSTLDLANLLNDTFPSNPVMMLYEWEETLGLPNPFAGTQTIPQRQAQVLNKFANSGGQTVAYFLSVIASLGYTGATITEYAPFRAGWSTAGSPCCGPGWYFTWLITAPNLSVEYFAAGQNAAGDSLYTLLGAAQLEYVISEYAPAHTNPLYAIVH